jgi:geranylgeranyl pyrophosphate synthase
VEWKISVPSLGGELIFEPLSDDQEIPVAGATRAIWEGAGRVTGFLGGRPVSGTARLELNGYGYVFQLADVLEHFSRRILRHIQDFFPEVPDEQYFEKCTGFAPEPGNVEAVRDFLTRPMWDLLARGGKYWRPMFGILMAEILGIDSTRYEDLLSVSTELTHLASLVVDDIEDNALTRRKEACIHLKYGTDIAINAANTLYFLPILKLRENAFITDEQKLAIYSKTMEFFVKAHFGQGLDISRKASMSLADGGDLAPLIRDSLNVYALKSAASVEFVTHTACIIANADQATAAALVAFARSFGVSFQIKDDVHDFGGAGIWTKEPGLDLACGKLTYVILLALEAATDDERVFLTRLLCKELPCTAANINRGMQIVRGSGALEKANAKVLSLLNDAWESLCRVVPQSDARIMLKVMCEHLLKLDYDSFDITA